MKRWSASSHDRWTTCTRGRTSRRAGCYDERVDRANRGGHRRRPAQGRTDGRGDARPVRDESGVVRRRSGRWRPVRGTLAQGRTPLRPAALPRASRRPLWLFSSGPLDASASERDIPPVPGVRRAMIRLDVQEHVTFDGCLEEGAKGFIARKIVSSGKGGDFRDFHQIETWAARIGSELAKESPRT